MKDAFIYEAIRSPRTRAKDSGGLHALTPQELLRQLYENLSQRCDLDPHLVGEIILGCVTQHGNRPAISPRRPHCMPTGPTLSAA